MYDEQAAQFLRERDKARTALAELEAEVRRFFAQQPHTDVMHSDAYREAYPRIAALLRTDGDRG